MTVNPYPSLRCQVIQRDHDHLVELEFQSPTTPPSTHRFSVDKDECPVSYAILLALTDFFEEHEVNPPVILYVRDLFAFNILTGYLKRWKASNWFSSNGKPVKYVDILSDFHDTMVSKKIGYKVLFVPNHT